MLQETCSAQACVLNSIRQLALGVLLASRFPIQVDENDFPGLCWQSCFEFPSLFVNRMLQETCAAQACVLNPARQLALGVLLASRFPIQVDENHFPGLCWQSCFEFPSLFVNNSPD